MDIKRLSGKVIVITGANSGIGYATAQEAIAEGATVIVAGRDQKKVDEACKKLGAQAIPFKADVANLNEIDDLFSFAKNKFQRVDGLVVNAGILIAGNCAEVTPEAFDQTMNINIKGAFFTVQKALPLMKSGGSIVLIGSLGAEKAFEGISIYAASKAAMLSFAKNLALELAPAGIRVNSMSPGVTETPIFEKIGVSSEDAKGILKDYAALIPLKRVAQPEEIAKAINFLLSDDSSFITGINLRADGGFRG